MAAPEEAVRLSPSRTQVRPERHRSATFASLRTRNYRLFAAGQVFSNTGTWAQRIAQDWLVLSLTGSAADVGITTTMQFVPFLIFGMIGGSLADRYPKRRILLCTQAAMSVLAASLAILTFTHRIEYWHVWIVALLLGIVTAVDNPSRQSFVNEMVGRAHLSNAVSINSSIFQLGGLVGPALSGALMGAVGPGWSFATNAACYLAPFTSLLLMRQSELNIAPRPARAAAGSAGELKLALGRPEIWMPAALAASFSLFTANLPVTLASYAKSVLHSGPTGYGFLSATVAVGSLVGALISARRARTRLATLLVTGAMVAVAELAAAAAPGRLALYPVLAALGAFTLLLMTATNSTVQIASDDATRGRVMAFYLLLWVGAAAFGGPLLGSVDQHFGPRSGLTMAGTVSGLATVAIGWQLRRAGARSGRTQDTMADSAKSEDVQSASPAPATYSPRWASAWGGRSARSLPPRFRRPPRCITPAAQQVGSVVHMGTSSGPT